MVVGFGRTKVAKLKLEGSDGRSTSMSEAFRSGARSIIGLHTGKRNRFLASADGVYARIFSFLKYMCSIVRRRFVRSSHFRHRVLGKHENMTARFTLVGILFERTICFLQELLEMPLGSCDQSLRLFGAIST